VSKEEVIAVLLLVKQHALASHLPAGTRYCRAARAMFQLHDSDGAGTIENLEFAETLNEVVSALCSLAAAALDHTRPVLLDTPLRSLTAAMLDRLGVSPSDGAVSFASDPAAAGLLSLDAAGGADVAALAAFCVGRMGVDLKEVVCRPPCSTPCARPAAWRCTHA
jgi:hypothetical protein